MIGRTYPDPSVDLVLLCCRTSSCTSSCRPSWAARWSRTIATDPTYTPASPTSSSRQPSGMSAPAPLSLSKVLLYSSLRSLVFTTTTSWIIIPPSLLSLYTTFFFFLYCHCFLFRRLYLSISLGSLSISLIYFLPLPLIFFLYVIPFSSASSFSFDLTFSSSS